ncbi:protein kinase [bacterium]|nr:protein kinase [bacterium]
MRIGDYEVLSEIGKGGVGVVLRARGHAGRDVAVKLLKRASEAQRARFEREVRLLASLGESHGFVPLLDHGDSEKGPFLVMPFLAGGTLRDRLMRGPLAVEETISLGRALAGALARAHEAGVVHRDLKPENILFSTDGRPLVADLGLAKHFDLDPTLAMGTSLSQTGELRGTVGYMAPEQMVDSTGVDARSDVFSLGAILYECLSGEAAFLGATPLDVIHSVVARKLAPLGRARPDAPAWLVSAIDRALAADPDVRFADGAALARALDEGPRARSSRRAPVVAAGALGVIAALAGAIALASVERERALPSPAPAPSPSPRPSSKSAPAPPKPPVRAAPREGTWAMRAPLPTPRMKMAAATTDDGKIYVLGGRTIGGSLATNEVYDPSRDRWSSRAPLGTARLLHGAAALGTKVYVAGGTSDGTVPIASVEEYDSELDRWRELAPLPSPCKFVRLVAHRGKLWAFGAPRSGPALAFSYDPGKGAWGAGPPVSQLPWLVARTPSLVAIFETERLLLGPREGLPVPFLEVAGATLEVRAAAASAALGERVYEIGGLRDGALTTEVWSLDVEAAASGRVVPCRHAPLKRGRRELAAAVSNGKVYAIGGFDGGAQALDVVEELTP